MRDDAAGSVQLDQATPSQDRDVDSETRESHMCTPPKSPRFQPYSMQADEDLTESTAEPPAVVSKDVAHVSFATPTRRYAQARAVSPLSQYVDTELSKTFVSSPLARKARLPFSRTSSAGQDSGFPTLKPVALAPRQQFTHNMECKEEK